MKGVTRELEAIPKGGILVRHLASSKDFSLGITRCRLITA